MKALCVKCDNVERGCEWEGTVGTLEEHVDTCDFTVVNCPKECNKKVIKKDLVQHLKEECPNRDYECQHCGEKDMYANITEIHYDECTMIVLPCPNSECTQTMERAKIQMHIENDCEHTVISCKYERIGCDVNMKRKDMGAHEQDDKAHLHQALNTVVKLQDNLLSATDTIVSMKKDMAVKLDLATETIASMKKESSAMAVKLDLATETIASMKKESSAMAVKLESATRTIASMKKESSAMAAKLESAKIMQQGTAIKLNQTAQTTRVLQASLQETTMKAKRDMIYSFRMTKYEKRKTADDFFYSQPFYTSSSGYHMRIKVYPNGNGDGQGTHVSVYAELMQGRYDQQLSWPFVGNVTVELLNQLADEKHHSMTIPLYPENNSNIGSCWGYFKFTPHSRLSHDPVNNTQYLKDNTLYFGVSVEVKGCKP